MLRMDFNEGWMFQNVPGGMMAGTDAAVPVTLPHDAVITEPRKKENASGNSGGFYPGGTYSYTKTFYVPEEMEGKTMLLEFQGVYHQAKVYANGDFICGNLYGYTEFYADLTGHLKFGRENVVEVKIDNSDAPSGRWYTGGGIFRPVSLLTGEEISVPENGVRLTTVEAAEDISAVEAAIRLKNTAGRTQRIRIRTEIREKDTGLVVCRENTPVTVYPGEAPLIRQRLYIRQAKLWSVDSPELYGCHIKVIKADCEAGDAQILDEAEETFGIRHIQIDPLHGFRLNGKKVLLRGACIHHDNGILGAAAFAKAEERKVRLCREAGFNALRIAHNPASRALLEACDRLGMLVMEESFDMWNHSKLPNDYARYFADDWEETVRSIIEKDYNHPCVVMYSIGNEIQEIGTPAGARMNREITETCRRLDPTRFVTNGINGLMTVMDQMGTILRDLGLAPVDQEKEGGDINDLMTAAMDHTGELIRHPLIGERIEESCGGLDISGYNYMTARYPMDTGQYPNRIIVGSETYPPQIAANWKHIKENPAVLGDFTWTGYDYIGESGIGVPAYNEPGGFFTEYPCYLANVGDLDLIGFRRPASYYREIVWGLRKEPYLAVQIPEHYGDTCALTPWITEPAEASWTWRGYEGKPCRVEVYSADEEVELLINGASCGRLPTGETHGFKAVFDTVYRPGTITAVAYTDKKETGRFEIATVQGETALVLSSEGTELSAKDREVAFLTIALKDRNGTLDMCADKKVSVQVSGAGILQGFGSADPLSTENFYDTRRTLYRGMLLAAVRANGEEGEIVVRAEADGCEAVEWRLNAR